MVKFEVSVDIGKGDGTGAMHRLRLTATQFKEEQGTLHRG